MFPYNQYAYEEQIVLGKPTYDLVNNIYVVTIVSGEYHILPEAMDRAKMDAQSQINNIDKYDPVAAKQELQQVTADIDVAEQDVPGNMNPPLLQP